MTTQNNNTDQVEMLKAQLAEAQAENFKLKNKAVGGIKITPKGCVGLYGLGRYPIVLYAQQWESLFERVEDIKAFITAHPELSRKARAADTAKTEATEQSGKAQLVDEIVDEDVNVA